jgi:O-acetyl-ADP-ribose deacetylase (regulator of RNase III)
VISEAIGRSNRYLSNIKLVRGDITHQDVDAVVTLMPQDLEYRGELNAALLRGAGEQLDRFLLDNIVKPRPGDIYAVPGFNLPCRHVFFCIVPRWRTDFDREDRELLNACRKAMEMARAMSLSSIAFPPLGSGAHGFPKKRAARLIVQGIVDRLNDDLQDVRIVCQTAETLGLFRERLWPMGWRG